MKHKLFALSLLFTTAVSGASPQNPWPLEGIDHHLEQLNIVKKRAEELLGEIKPKKDDFATFFRSTSYLREMTPRDGAITFELDEPNRFINGNSLMFKVALRDNETLSGPLRKEFNQNVWRILDIVNRTIKYYTVKAKKYNRALEVELQEPYGLLTYQRPEPKNSRLAGIFSEIFRDEDGHSGGTAGMLLIETREGRELKHLEKATNSARGVLAIIKEEKLSVEDRKIAQRVLADLRTAISEALEYHQSESGDSGFESN